MSAATSGLSSNDRRSLAKLVDHDFAQLKVELTEFAGEVLDQRLTELRKDRAVVIRRKRALVGKLNSHLDAFVALASSDNEFDIEVSDYHVTNLRNSIKVDSADVARAEALVRDETKRDLEKALSTLERERINSQRQLLTTELGDEARKVLDGIPSARTLLAAAGVARQQLAGSSAIA